MGSPAIRLAFAVCSRIGIKPASAITSLSLANSLSSSLALIDAWRQFQGVLTSESRSPRPRPQKRIQLSLLRIIWAARSSDSPRTDHSVGIPNFSTEQHGGRAGRDGHRIAGTKFVSDRFVWRNACNRMAGRLRNPRLQTAAPAPLPPPY